MFWLVQSFIRLIMADSFWWKWPYLKAYQDRPFEYIGLPPFFHKLKMIYKMNVYHNVSVGQDPLSHLKSMFLHIQNIEYFQFYIVIAGMEIKRK